MADDLAAVGTEALVQELKKRFDEVDRARAQFGVLTDGVVIKQSGSSGKGRRKGTTMSAEARARISAAQKKRWAKARKGKKAE